MLFFNQKFWAIAITVSLLYVATPFMSEVVDRAFEIIEVITTPLTAPDKSMAVVFFGPLIIANSLCDWQPETRARRKIQKVYNLAWSRHLAEAEALLETCQPLNGWGRDDAWQAIAGCYERVRRYEDAERCYLKGLQLAKGGKDRYLGGRPLAVHMYVVAEFYLNSNRSKDAWPLLLQARQQMSSYVSRKKLAGRVQYSCYDYDMEKIEQAIKLCYALQQKQGSPKTHEEINPGFEQS